jgi:hypothetical protein
VSLSRYPLKIESAQGISIENREGLRDIHCFGGGRRGLEPPYTP